MEQVPADVVSLADYERHARSALPDDIWAYIAGAGADGLTRQRNRDAFDRTELAGRVLVDMAGATTKTTLFGIDLPFPLLLAPVAYQKLVHPQGEIATALGAASCGTGMCISTLASSAIEDITARNGVPFFFQLYMQDGRETALALLRRAEDAGCRAIIFTVDAPVNGIRNEEHRAGFQLPAHVRAVNVETAKAFPRVRPGESPVFKGLLEGAPTWADLEWLRAQTTLPLILKGVMHPDDAQRALELGMNGIVVSNHGGRTLDTLPASLEALKAVYRRIGGKIPLLMDGGIRRGTDILKALASGADAVMIGQPIMHALAVAGPVGVAHMLLILRAEFEVAMSLTGCRSIDEVDASRLW